MPIIYLEAENIIERIHNCRVLSYRDIIKKMDVYRRQYPGGEMTDIEAAYLVAAELEIEIDFEAEIQTHKITRLPRDHARIGDEC